MRSAIDPMVGVENSWTPKSGGTKTRPARLIHWRLDAVNSETGSPAGTGANIDDGALDPLQGRSDPLYPSNASEAELTIGERINEYCNRHRMDIPGRLRLFRQVCATVHSAHQHALIHGNLKPESILVAPDGVPRITGFRDPEQIGVTFQNNAVFQGQEALDGTGPRHLLDLRQPGTGDG